jgi:flagellar basal body P-ring formation protein FlgA
MMCRIALLAVAFAAGAGAALAAQPVALRAVIADEDGRITLGELFEGAGRASPVLVYTTRPGSSAVLDAALVQRVAMANGLSWANEQGLRRVVVRPSVGAAPASARMVEVLTYTRSLAAGEMVGPEDLAWTKATAAPADAPRDADLVIGMMAKRPLRAGSAVAQRDVSPPLVIKKDEVVQVSYNAGGISLSLQAKAMKAAGVGETVDLMNPASKKIIQAVAIGPGQAVIGPGASGYKSAGAASRLASLR